MVPTKASKVDEPPSLKPKEKSRTGAIVKSLIRDLALKKGPGEIFPSIGKAAKGERLLFVRRTSIFSNDQAWIVVKKNSQMYYVWEGFVQFE